MARCEEKEDCDVGIRMICVNKKCDCRPGDLFFEWPKYGCFVKAVMFAPCEVSGQCLAMNPNTYCNPESGRCTCSPNYFFNGHECSLRYDGSNLKAQEVYKAAVVAAACFIVAVVGIFVACIVRRSFCRREQQLQQSESNRNSDIFSISDEIAALRAVDKPPSYEEVLQIERTFYGIPPPEYTGPRIEILSTEQSSTASASQGTERLNSEFQSTSHSTINDSSSFSQIHKDLTDCSTNTVETLSDVNNSNISECTAEVEISVPFHQESTNQNIPSKSEGSSHTTHSSYSFSTPPPPRLHQNSIKSEHGSSSLPSSPHRYRSTISTSTIISAVDACTISNNELSETTTTRAEMNHSRQNSCHSESSYNLTLPCESDTCRNESEFSHSIPVIAYDNLGFESDMYL